jgi:hypothetical protein
VKFVLGFGLFIVLLSHGRLSDHFVLLVSAPSRLRVDTYTCIIIRRYAPSQHVSFSPIDHPLLSVCHRCCPWVRLLVLLVGAGQDKHPISSIQPPLYRTPPLHMPDIAFHFTDEVLHTSPWMPASLNATLTARQMYRASVTGMDRKLGVLLAELDTLGLVSCDPLPPTPLETPPLSSHPLLRVVCSCAKMVGKAVSIVVVGQVDTTPPSSPPPPPCVTFLLLYRGSHHYPSPTCWLHHLHHHIQTNTTAVVLHGDHGWQLVWCSVCCRYSMLKVAIRSLLSCLVAATACTCDQPHAPWTLTDILL